jgi:hypothetical protein
VSTHGRAGTLTVSALGLCVLGACSLPNSPDDGAEVVPVPERTWQTTVPEALGAFPPPDDVQCQGVQSFAANVLPQLRQHCVSCHAGNKLAATNGFDLRTAVPGTDGAEACRYVLYAIDPNAPLESAFFEDVDPASQVVHDFKFNTAGEYVSYVNAVKTWLETES